VGFERATFGAARKKRNLPELDRSLSGRLEINMGKTLTKFGGLGAKAEGGLRLRKKWQSEVMAKHAHTDTRHLLNTRGINCPVS
jgi:hypothetical protein